LRDWQSLLEVLAPDVRTLSERPLAQIALGKAEAVLAAATATEVLDGTGARRPFIDLLIL